jgi:hypothetical protein
MFMTSETWSPDQDAARVFMQRIIKTGKAIELDRLANSWSLSACQRATLINSLWTAIASSAVR